MLLKCKEVSEAYSSWKASVFSLGFKNHVDDQFSIIWFCVFSVYMYVPATTQSDLCMCCTAGHIQFFLGSDSGCWSYGYDRVSREVSSPTVLWIEFRSDDVTKIILLKLWDLFNCSEQPIWVKFTHKTFAL